VGLEPTVSDNSVGFWGGRAYSSPEELNVSLNDFIEVTAKSHNISIMESTLIGKFGGLIRELHKSTGRQVVVLVDEYDKPITDYLSDINTMTANKNVLHNFYQVLKAADEHINFVFLTGVSKFSGVSVFSALNNLDDITLSWDYASICGYTQEELESYFTEYIDKVALYNKMTENELLEKIKKWYDGYSWDGETSVYNPFSILSFFSNEEFGNYWFRTGTPTFLINILKSRNQIQSLLGTIDVGSSAFNGYNPVNTGEIPLLLQTGYLTIKHKTTIFGHIQYTLDIPNLEVRESFSKYLLNAYSDYPLEQMLPLISNMKKQIYDGDTSGLEQNLRMLLANIPYNLHVKNEAYYHSLFLLIMKVLGFDIHGEVLTNIGRIDAVWTQPGLTVVAELKYGSKKSADDLLNKAMAQIRDRRYYEAYLDGKVMLMAIAFTGKDVKCEMEMK
jgi:hypothetical protein